MEFQERQNLYKVRKTVLEMISDRGYYVPEAEKLTFEEFLLKYNNNNLDIYINDETKKKKIYVNFHNELKELQAQLAHNNNGPFIKKQNKPNTDIQSKKFVEPDRHPLDLTIKNNDTESDDDSNYYQIKKYNKKNKDDIISDIYIEPPYN